MLVKRSRGISLLEITAALLILSVLIAVGMPAVAELAGPLTLRAAADDVTAIFNQARGRALSHRRIVGLKWFATADDVIFTMYDDGNGNGVHSADIQRGLDPRVAGPFSMRKRYRGVSFSFLPDLRLDPSGSPIGNLADPIRFGRSDICSFTPLGDASPGSVYLSNGDDRQAVVRVSPTTARIQLLEWDRSSSRWLRKL